MESDSKTNLILSSTDKNVIEDPKINENKSNYLLFSIRFVRIFRQ